MDNACRMDLLLDMARWLIIAIGWLVVFVGAYWVGQIIFKED